MTTVWEEDTEVLETNEVHWSTSTILTIFFSASLISALFFGLGFSFGRDGTAKSRSGDAMPSAAETSEPSQQIASTSSIADFPAHPRYTAKGAPGRVKLEAISTSEKVPSAGTVLPDAAKPPTVETAHTADASASAKSHGHGYMVQVGAIGNRKDALKLVSQLRKQGFHAGVYPGARDKFLHVQLGPYASTEQAQSIRHRVMAHGYRALLKPAS